MILAWIGVTLGFVILLSPFLLDILCVVYDCVDYLVDKEGDE